jgi:hypothetical protein
MWYKMSCAAAAASAAAAAREPEGRAVGRGQKHTLRTHSTLFADLFFCLASYSAGVQGYA